jgi:hypothetical protein
MTRKTESIRSIAMSDLMKSIKAANPGLKQTKVLTIASKELSRSNKTSENGKLSGTGLSLAPSRGSGLFLKPYR